MNSSADQRPMFRRAHPYFAGAFAQYCSPLQLGSLLTALCALFCLGTSAPADETGATRKPVSDSAQSPGGIQEINKLSLEDLMKVKVTTQSTLSRVDERIDLAPGSVYVITRDTIQNRGYRSLGELLQTVPGFTVFHRDLDFVVGVRGFNANDNDKISLLVNGQRFFGLHEQSFLNGPINLDNVERVEVVVGPSSFFQPADTLAATVNLITRDVDGVQVIAATGNGLKYSGTLMAGHHWAPDKFVSFSFTTEAKSGFDAWNRDFQSGLAGRKLTGELDWPSYFGLFKAQNGDLSMQASAYRSSWPELHIDNGSPLNDGTMSEQFYSMLLKHEHKWTDALTSVIKFDIANKQQTRLNENTEPTNAVEQSVKQLTYEGEIGLRYTGFAHQLIQAGVQISHDHNYATYFTFNNNETNEHITKTTLVDQDTDAVGFYLDDTYQLTKRLKLIGGIREDYNSRLEGDRWFTGARGAIIYEASDHWITKLIYNRSVRMPSALSALNKVWGSDHADLFSQGIVPSFARLSSQATNPEILSTFEFQNIFYLGKVRVGTSVYHEELQDFITWFGPHSNGGNFRGNGVEVNVQAPLGPKVTFWANGAWNDTKLDLFNAALFGPPTAKTESIHSYVNPDGRIIGSAAYTANLGFDIKLMEHLTFSPSLRYFTEQAGVDFAAAPDSPTYKTIRNRYYLDAGLKWDHVWGKDMDIRLSANNILDNRSQVASQINGDTYRPRGVEVVVTVEMRF